MIFFFFITNVLSKITKFVGGVKAQSAYLLPGTISISQTFFHDMKNVNSKGGAIFVAEANTYVTISECAFSDCAAQNTYLGEGGAIYVKSCIDFHLLGSISKGCSAAKGYQFLFAKTSNEFVVYRDNILNCGQHKTGYPEHTLGLIRGEQVLIHSINCSNNHVNGQVSGMSIINQNNQAKNPESINASSFKFMQCNFINNSGQNLLLFSGKTYFKNLIFEVNIKDNKIVHSSSIGIIRFSGEWIIKNCLLIGQGPAAKLCSVGQPCEINFIEFQNCLFDGNWRKVTKKYIMKECKKMANPTLIPISLNLMTFPTLPLTENKIKEILKKNVTKTNTTRIRLVRVVKNEDVAENDFPEDRNDEEQQPKEEEQKPKEEERPAAPRRVNMRLVDPYNFKEMDMIVPNDQKPQDVPVMYPQFCCKCKFTKKIEIKPTEPIEPKKPAKNNIQKNKRKSKHRRKSSHRRTQKNRK